MYKSLLILLFTASIMFGCSANKNGKKDNGQAENQMAETTPSPATKAGITETYWKLISLQGEPVPLHKDQREAHIILKNKDERVAGSGGCNVLNGTYEIEGNNQISFSKMAATKMACPHMETEQKFLKIFEKIDTYHIQGDTLLFNDSNKNTLAKFVSVKDKAHD